MLPYHKGDDDSTRLFYDLSSSKVRRLDLPETREVDICGSSHGWFVLHDGEVTSLLNPLTRATVALPSFTVLPAAFMPYLDDEIYQISNIYGEDCLKPTNFRVLKARLTSSPLDPDCLVFVTTLTALRLAFCKIGDECWTVIDLEANMKQGRVIVDLSYSNGFLYTVDSSAHFMVYDINSRSQRVLPCNVGQDGTRLIEGMLGDILITKYRELAYVDGVLPRETEFTVYKLSNGGDPEMIKKPDIGQHVFFLVRNCQALSLSNADLQLPGWGANCIFYDSQWFDFLDETRKAWFNHNIKMERLDDGTITEISDLGTFKNDMYWQQSLWLTPSFL